MSDTVFILALIGFFLMLFGSILFVIFGQITVRKLRRNPATKDHLGLEFVSGWDILNIATSLALPLFISQKLEKSPFSFTQANAAVLRQHTNKIDRLLAFTVSSLLYSCTFVVLLAAILNSLI